MARALNWEKEKKKPSPNLPPGYLESVLKYKRRHIEKIATADIEKKTKGNTHCKNCGVEILSLSGKSKRPNFTYCYPCFRKQRRKSTVRAVS